MTIKIFIASRNIRKGEAAGGEGGKALTFLKFASDASQLLFSSTEGKKINFGENYFIYPRLFHVILIRFLKFVLNYRFEVRELLFWIVMERVSARKTSDILEIDFTICSYTRYLF